MQQSRELRVVTIYSWIFILPPDFAVKIRFAHKLCMLICATARFLLIVTKYKLRTVFNTANLKYHFCCIIHGLESALK